MIVSPAPSNASTTSFKPSASQQTYSGQIKKKKKIKRVLDSDDETPCTCFLYLVYRNLHGASNEGALDDTGIPTAIPIHYIRLETQNLAYPAKTTLGRRYPFPCIIVHPAPRRPYRFRPARPTVPPFGAYETRTETTDETGP